MEIQWVIITALPMIANLDRTIDINRIFHHYRVTKEFNRASFHLCMKLNISPIELGDAVNITVQIKHDRHGLLESHNRTYKLPDFITGASRTTYIDIGMTDIELPYEGIYTFALLVDGEYKNEEILRVSYLEGG
jgi:hypothetical protein